MSGCLPPFFPKDSSRILYSIRATVEAHDIYKSGRFIFRKKTPVICVRVREDHLAAFNKIACNYMATDRNNFVGIASVLEFDTPEKQQSEYPIGAEVGITFGYSSPLDQFFNGNEPLKFMKIQVLGADTCLENEVRVSSVVNKNNIQHGPSEQ